MIDLFTINKIQYLHPKIRKEVLVAYNIISDKLLNQHILLKLPYTYFTKLEQDFFYNIGRTILFDERYKRLGIVTMDKGGQSLHNYGLAFDVTLLEDKIGDGIYQIVPYDLDHNSSVYNFSPWQAVIDSFQEIGWSWGRQCNGIIDPTHFEKNMGYSTIDLQNKVKSGKVFTEIIHGKPFNWVEI